MLLVLRDERGAIVHREDRHPVIHELLAAAGIAVGRVAVHAGRDSGADGVDSPSLADPAALDGLRQSLGIRGADRVTLFGPDARWGRLRSAFRRRHVHADHEVRIFLAGQGLFELPWSAGALAQLLCEAGDWVALPPGTPHAFDAGERPRFDALRWFSQPEGWLADDAADAASAPVPDLDRFLAEVTGEVTAAARARQRDVQPA